MSFRKCKGFISLLIVASMLFSMGLTAIASDAYGKYEDFPTGWSKAAMEHAVDNGLLNGRSATTIVPEGNLTRAEMATIINRAFGATIKADISKYTDVAKDAWYYDEIAKAVNMRTFVGDSASTINPDANITREEVFTVIARALVLETEDFSSLEKYPDKGLVSDWAKSAAAILLSKGYIQGNDAGNLCPQCDITREEFAQMMYNIIKTYYTEEGAFETTGLDSSLIRTSGVTLQDVVIDGDLIIGDGVGNGTVTLKNVTIKGRLLCRGGEKAVKLINTTVGEYVVVYDVNGTVHFDNYRSEKPFKNIREITPATFLKKTGIGGGNGSSGGTTKTYYTVSFHNGANQDAFTTVSIDTAATEANRNLAAINKELDSIYAAYLGGSNIVYNRTDLGYNNLGTLYEHQVEKEYIYESAPGVWEVFTEATTVDKDIDVYYAIRRASVTLQNPQLDALLGMPYSLEICYDSKSRLADSFKDVLIKIGLVLDNNEVRSRMTSKLSNLYAKTGMVNAEADILDTIYGLQIPEIIESDLIDGVMKFYVINKIEADDFTAIDDLLSAPEFIQAVATVSGQSLSTKQEVINYVSAISTADLESLIHHALDNYSVYTAFRSEVLGGNTFTVKKDTIPFARAIAEAIDAFGADDIRQKLQTKGFGPVISLLGNNKFDEVFATAKNVYCQRLENTISRVVSANAAEAYTASLRVNIPMILEGVYDKYSAKFRERIENNAIYDYNQNDALQKLVALDWFEMIVAKRAPGYDVATPNATGYYIRDYMDYYSLMLDAAILFDQALCYYDTQHYDEAEFILIKESLTKDLLAFLEGLQSLSDKIANNDAIVGSYTLQDLIDKVAILNNVANSTGGNAGAAIKTVADKVKSILEGLGYGNLPGGNTLDDLNVLAAKLETVVRGMNASDYASVNQTFNEVIASAIDRLDAIIDELDQNGTVAGKPLEDIFASISVLHDFYNKYAAEITSVISALANADLGSIGINIDSERFVNSMFGRETENIINVDSMVDAVKGKLGTSAQQGYASSVYTIDKYVKQFGDSKITLQRKFH